MEPFEKLTLDSAQNRSSLWLRCVDDIFVVWPPGPERLQNFLSHLNSLRPSVQFTMGIESDSAIHFLNVVVVRKETTLATKVYMKPTHTGRYLSFASNHPPHVKRGLIRSFHNRASAICHERQDLLNEISSASCDLQLNGFPQGSMTRPLIPRAAVVRVNRKSLWDLVYPIFEGCLREVQTYREFIRHWNDLQN
jgi:hypothetical protein